MDGIGLQVLVQPTHPLQLPDSHPLLSSLSLGRVLITTQEARGPHQPTMDPKPSHCKPAAYSFRLRFPYLVSQFGLPSSLAYVDYGSHTVSTACYLYNSLILDLLCDSAL